MTDETTPRLKAPLMVAGQAQKHVTHNEAIMVLDALAQLSVVSSISTPPLSPVADSVYIIGASPTGVWAGKANQIARYQDGAWAYSVPQIGWRAWTQDNAQLCIFTGSTWMNYNSLAFNNVPMLGVNTTANSTTKFMSKSDANLFDNITGSTRVNVNKTAMGDTASFIFQKNYSGRAEFGLMGVDTFGVKVSADGTGWKQAISVDGAGCVSFPSGVDMPSFMNVIINGGFDIWQRGNSFTVSTAAYNFTADKWYCFINAGSIAVSRQSAIAIQAIIGNHNPYYACFMQTGSGAATNEIGTKIESVATFSGKNITLSLWSNATNGQIVNVILRQSFGSGGSPSVSVNTNIGSFTPSVNWTKYSFTAELPSIAGKTLGSAGDDRLEILLQFSSGATWTLNLSSVQLEEGANAKYFVRRSLGQELALCQRYYQEFPDYIVQGNRLAGTKVYNDIILPVTMRAAPTVALGAISYSNASNYAVNSTTMSKIRLEIIITADGYGFGYNGKLKLDAEL